jgi:hypothetical protein
MSKLSLFAALLFGLLAYAAYDPSVVERVADWCRRQAGGTGQSLPSGGSVGYTNYQPVVPGR